MSDGIRVWDLEAFRAATGEERAARARDLDDILRTTGFLTLAGHGVPQDAIDDVRAATAAFFAQPPEAKAQVAAPYKGYPYGWLGPLAEALAASRGEATPPDLKESFNGGPLEVPGGVDDPDAHAFCYQPTLWPDVPGFRAAWERYYREMEALAARVMGACAAALGLPEDHFEPSLRHPVSALRALNYPATDADPEAGQQRAGAHTDYGTLTILLPQAGSRGLEIRTPAGEWAEVTPQPGCFVVNIGDLMARWTADRWVSTLHRVVAHAGQPGRQSLAFFHQPDWEAEIVPLDGSDAYPPVRSGPYLMGKFRATGA
ncbi:isopenicillin N synthase family dioxygenase [Wenxinia marina]|uniref:2-oxoglutarate-dependent ethylene/succinate-forming enzyme n=1 Tax=Wenxinia marina DSM 24838 TaxID=1123501 RepID=A0A0D0QDA9_9RHOB|nr:2OG-Fe(II) oxygenase family protein [Wenxinia marina]KIQ68988.1 Isopenicillin N synthase [Wenxinia marina DSM 24838]GGL63550.1 2OG-Fe(II) oxygenase [Wenxinia marina]